MQRSRRVLLVQCTDHEVSAHYTALESSIKPADVVSGAYAAGSIPDVFYQPRDSGIDTPLPLSHVCQPQSVTQLPLGIAAAAYSVTQPRDSFNGNTWTPCPLFLIVRSSTGTKSPLRQANAPGLIDEGYRGTIMAAVDNVSSRPFTATSGARYFQLLACDGQPFDEIRVVDTLPSSKRGDGGFGSTGH